MNDKEKIRNALDVIERMIDFAEGDLEQGVKCSSEKLEVLEDIKKILED